jgi:outer membrane scaffolding protein for murein synthesis (MipA/OmpV family)
LIAFDGPVWRLVTEHLIEAPTTPAAAPEGRFHHSGQVAAYASLTAEGAAVAIERYLSDNHKRFLVPMWLKAEAVADVRGEATASVVWQDQRQSGAIASTWAISDVARQAGAQALLYSSRSRPELSHVVVFDPSCLTYNGPTTPMTAINLQS